MIAHCTDLADVLVVHTLYSDMVTDLYAGLGGGLGVPPATNIGTEVALIEHNHGSAPNHASKNKVNPMAMIYSGAMMLRWIGENQAADRLERALDETIAEGKDVSYDLKQDCNDPTAIGTSQVADALIKKLR